MSLQVGNGVGVERPKSNYQIAGPHRSCRLTPELVGALKVPLHTCKPDENESPTTEPTRWQIQNPKLGEYTAPTSSSQSPTLKLHLSGRHRSWWGSAQSPTTKLQFKREWHFNFSAQSTNPKLQVRRERHPDYQTTTPQPQQQQPNLPNSNYQTQTQTLQDGTSKMSKSDENDMSRINLLDSPDVIRNKVPWSIIYYTILYSVLCNKLLSYCK